MRLHRQPKPLAPLSIRGRLFDWQRRTHLMGIINATPDSFSGDGVGDDVAAAVAKARELAAGGCDIIDIGGESTRPGHEPVGEEEERRRVIPVVSAVRAALDIPISVDTFKPNVGEAALAAGADIINCQWGADEGMAELAGQRGAPLIVMHNQTGTSYSGDCVAEVIRFLEAAAAHATLHGVATGSVIVDPGIGFGKTPDQNVEVLERLPELAAQLPYPLLVGVSRKSFIGRITGNPVSERIFGTAAALALAVAGGADIVRVHDAAAMRDVVAVSDAICRFGSAQPAPQPQTGRPAT